VFAAGIFYIHGGSDFGDGSDRAVVGIEDDFID
jgi:hypothetical protein